MQKPGKKTKSYYDYNECIKYIEHKYNYNTRDFKNSAKNYNHTFKQACEELNYSFPDITSLYEIEDELAKYLLIQRMNQLTPYCDHWHWVVDRLYGEVTNGSFFEFLKEEWETENTPDWVKQINNDLFTEFGEGQDFIEFYVWW